MALDKIVERVDETEISGSVILSAIKLLHKNNGAGQGGEPAQNTDFKKLFERMSPEERENFAKDGSLPAWFLDAMGITPES